MDHFTSCYIHVLATYTPARMSTKYGIDIVNLKQMIYETV